MRLPISRPGTAKSSQHELLLDQPHALAAEDVLAVMGVSVAAGFTSEEVGKRRSRFGAQPPDTGDLARRNVADPPGEISIKLAAHVAHADRQVVQQRWIVARLEGDRTDTTGARTILAQFEEILENCITDRDRLLRQLRRICASG